MENKHDILGIYFDDMSLENAYNNVVSYIKGSSLKKVYTPNPEFLLNAKNDPSFKDTLNRGDLVLADGIGVILCSKILKRTISQRVRGVDLVLKILDNSKKNPVELFILGSTEDNCRSASKKIFEKYPAVKLLGYQNGYYDISEEDKIADRINSLKPDLLLVGLGSPRQEIFIDRYKERLNNVKCAMGVGGTIDVLSGNTKLAPAIFRKIGLEWLYRTVSEPKRIKRVIKLPLVLIYAVIDRSKHR